MYYINKLYELGQISFKTTDPSIIDELLVNIIVVSVRLLE